MQARAALASAQAAEALAAVTAQRWQTLGSTNAVAKQTVDEKIGDLTVKQALAKAAQANVDRLNVLSDFKRVTAPFDGIVTARNTDVGALINADSSAGLALFVVSDISKLRVTVSVPQNFVPAVKMNSKVHDHRAGISQQDLQRRGRGLGALRRCGVRHHPHAARRRQRGRRADAGRLRQYPHRAAAGQAGASAFRPAR